VQILRRKGRQLLAKAGTESPWWSEQAKQPTGELGEELTPVRVEYEHAVVVVSMSAEELRQEVYIRSATAAADGMVWWLKGQAEAHSSNLHHLTSSTGFMPFFFLHLPHTRT
jgi:hypothetical protein